MCWRRKSSGKCLLMFSVTPTVKRKRGKFKLSFSQQCLQFRGVFHKDPLKSNLTLSWT